MNVAVIHYHLNRGGVSRVIANHLRSLDRVLRAVEEKPWQAAILFDGQADGWPENLASELPSIDLSLCQVPGLGYDDGRIAEPGLLATELRDRLRDLGFLPHETILHVHNHNLGKNASLPGALAQLAEEGYRLVLQIHDFAEDLRPANYRLLAAAFGISDVPARLYPQASHLHYAVLNGRDLRVLQRAGISDQRLHFLPNPVPSVDNLPSYEQGRDQLCQKFGILPGRRYVLYPVRGIRRKNLGEMLLWSALGCEKADFGLTLAPKNPVARVYYEQWAKVAGELSLPCFFETGEKGALTFEQNLAAADWILTTSVAEGFGMAFLESWMANRPLAGRDLPEITADFRNADLHLDDSYASLPVPLDWVGGDRFLRSIEAAYSRLLDDYGVSASDERRDSGLVQTKTQHGQIDFADLDEPSQEQVIRRVCRDGKSRRELNALNPVIERVLTSGPSDPQATIEHNRRVIEQRYSLEASGSRLRSLYQAVLDSSPERSLSPLPEGDRILSEFLDGNRFRLIRGSE